MKIPPDLESAGQLERRILRLNDQVRQAGNWNLVVALAGISLAARLKKRVTLAWLSRTTRISGSTLHGLLSELERRGYAETITIRGKTWRRPTEAGLSLMNDLGAHSFGIRRKSSEDNGPMT